MDNRTNGSTPKKQKRGNMDLVEVLSSKRKALEVIDHMENCKGPCMMGVVVTPNKAQID